MKTKELSKQVCNTAGRAREWSLPWCVETAGEQMGRGGEAVLVSMVHKEKKDSRLEVAVVDNSDGSYSISYTPVEPGSYSVWDQPRVRVGVLRRHAVVVPAPCQEGSGAVVMAIRVSPVSPTGCAVAVWWRHPIACPRA
ncbi:tripartite motif-containing protein 45-like isoform X3 [Oncorhynchus mykiss]|uniref:tripartite motif-containing protein 45-like isoform X3 n=1 Tax=Oncorhynchus mykiss TaxID=8022 RepID=UPI001878D32F|nr:tripartite motif-containing protein 45-like isoform X3 [Oncorhynchus mykiss]